MLRENGEPHELTEMQPEMQRIFYKVYNQSRTNGPINAHLTIAQVMPKYNHNNEEQEQLL